MLRNWRRLLHWCIGVLLLGGIAWALHALLPPEPRWSARGRFDPSGLEGAWPLLMRVNATPQRWDGAANEAALTLIDSQSGNSRGSLFLDAGEIRSWTCSADGRLVAAAGADGVVRIADTHSGDEWQVDMEEPGQFSLRFAPDAEHLLVRRGADTGHLVHVPTGKRLRSFPLAGLPCIFSPNGDYLIHHTNAAPKRVALEVWDLRRGVAIAAIEGAEYLGISNDGNTLYARQRESGGNRFDRVIVWDMPAVRRRAEIAIPASDIVSLTLATDERAVAIETDVGNGKDGTTITFWDVPAARLLARSHIAGVVVGSGTFSGDGRYFAALTSDRATVVEVNTGLKLWDQVLSGIVWPMAAFFTSDSKTLVLQTKQNLQWRDAATGKLLEQRFETGQFTVPRSAAWQRDQLLAFDTPGWARPRETGWVVQQLRRWLPASWLPPDEVQLGVYVFDAASRRLLFEQAEPGLLTALLSDDGQTVLTIHSRDDGEQLLRCYDVPARKSLRWVLGVPLGLAAAVLSLRAGWRRWRRKPGVVAASPGAPPCP